MRPISGVPKPATSFNVSNACKLPITPHNAPSTPASPQFGTDPAVGGSGKRHSITGPAARGVEDR